MSNLKGTQTEQNILSALQGESVARNRYSFFEEQAKKEGNDTVAQLFEKMAKNEMYHARLWFHTLYGTKDSESNLGAAADGEHTEWEVMYPEFAQIARNEGFEEIAQLFERVGAIEKEHERVFIKAREALIQEKEKAENEAGVVYLCRYCGAIYKEKKAECEICGNKDCFDERVTRA